MVGSGRPRLLGFPAFIMYTKSTYKRWSSLFFSSFIRSLIACPIWGGIDYETQR